jgi:cyanophycinase
MSAQPGPLIIIGGHEDKDGERVILRAIAKRLGGGKLVIATVASHQPEGYFTTYQAAFGGIGVDNLVELYVNDRGETLDHDLLAKFDGAAGVFFSGGDQLRISSQIGAGASVMSETMLVKGPSTASHRIGDLHMAPGLGLVRDAIIDQHFAERGRMGRLLGAVAQNPRVLGIGIDEDTAIVLEAGVARVCGSGAVYIVDGSGVTHSNIAEARPERTLSMFGVRLNVLATGDRFDLAKRRPVLPAPDA